MQNSTQQSMRNKLVEDLCSISNSRGPRSLKTPETAPALLNEGQVAELLNVSRRQVKILRNQDWWPDAIALGARSLRWSRDELLAAVAGRAPRIKKQQEHKHLAEARAERRVYRDGKKLEAS